MSSRLTLAQLRKTAWHALSAQLAPWRRLSPWMTAKILSYSLALLYVLDVPMTVPQHTSLITVLAIVWV